MNIGEIGRTFFQYLYDGILIVDRDSVVQYINPAYTRITGITEDKIIGKPLKEVRPGARLVEVVSSGEPIVGALRREKGVDYTVNMSPILEDGKVTGAISVVSNIEDVRKLSKTINKYESEILRLENRMQAINRAKYTLDDIIAKDPVSVKLKDDVLRIARKETTVVLMGESGTGKEPPPEKTIPSSPSTAHLSRKNFSKASFSDTRTALSREPRKAARWACSRPPTTEPYF